MKTSRWNRPPGGLRTAGMALVVGSVATVAACGSEAAVEDLVARVGPYELTIDEAVQLLVDEERLPAEASVVESLAELWVDYTLLAEAAARDSTFSGLDLEPLVMRQLRQVMVFQLRDSVIQVDTFVTDDELRAMYEEEAPTLELRARHIMLQIPIGAVEADRDSVRAELEAIRERIVEGADFAQLARQYSQDPGTAAAGGDLGFFRRGDMVAPFEEAVLGLEPGEVSDVVQTPMGLHVIRLEERRTRGFEEVAPEFRSQAQARLIQEAESVFVAGLVDGASPRIREGAHDIVRDLASNPGSGLSGRAARRAVVEWESDRVTVGDIREVLQLESPALRDRLADSSDEEIEEFLESLARRNLLLTAARAAGLHPPADSIDALVDDARTQLRTAARRLGLLDLDQAPGEALEVAVQRAVRSALADNLSGATQVVPLGMVGFQLREGRSISVREAGIGEVIVTVARIRAARQLSPTEGSRLQQDTVGR